MQVIVVGGGASGLVAAIVAARKGGTVTIIEKNNKLGKKLYLTGNGRCNFWHEDLNINDYITSDKEILQSIIATTKNKVLPFFTNLGLVYKVINGYYYPFSNQATSLINALTRCLETLKVTIKLNEEVLTITKEKDFTIQTNKDIYHADKLILAGGGMAAPKTGSTGEVLTLASKLGHSINKVYPALVSLNGSGKYYAIWDGVRSETQVTLYIDNTKIREEIGEVQFTKTGLSGICIFNLSNYVTPALIQNKKVMININFVPWFKGTPQEFKKWLDSVASKNQAFPLGYILEGFLNYKISNLLLKLIGADAKTLWSSCNQEKLLNLLFSFPFEVTSTNSFEKAQVSGGGIPLSEINPKTMESLKCPDLYLTGEILDVTGFCGGYNLGFAWMSGLNAGEGCCQND